MSISVVIIAKNSINTIELCLSALKAFDDVVVFDNGSSDGTQEVCRRFSNVNLVEGEFIGFGPTKCLASTYAKHDWILSLDSDEIATDAFTKTVLSKQLDSDTVYSIERINYYKNIPITHGWSNDILPRLYNRNKTNICNSLVHEGVIVDNIQVEYLNAAVKHLRYTSISQFIIKADHYSTLFAKEYAGKRSSSPMKALSRSFVTFMRKYIFKGGFLDGYAGLVMAYSNMIENFYKYMKLYELNREIEEAKKQLSEKKPKEENESTL